MGGKLKFGPAVAGWTLERGPYGVLVRSGSLSVDEVDAVAALAERLGYDRVYPGIAHAEDQALFAFSNAEVWTTWRDELEAKLEGLAPLDAWILGTDVGISARTIAHVLGGRHLGTFGSGYPHDAGDFGRCLRLVRRMDWEGRLWEVAERYEDTPWRVIISNWPQLAIWYDAGSWELLGEWFAARVR